MPTPTDLLEDDLCRAFAEKMAQSEDFKNWVLSRTKFSDDRFIIGTTLIIIAGLSTTLTSAMPTIGVFGKIAALTLLAGIVGYLIILPALMGGPGRHWFGRRPTIKPQEASP